MTQFGWPQHHDPFLYSLHRLLSYSISAVTLPQPIHSILCFVVVCEVAKYVTQYCDYSLWQDCHEEIHVMQLESDNDMISVTMVGIDRIMGKKAKL